MNNQTPKKVAARPNTIEYACERLGLSKPSVYSLIHAGKLRTYTVGRARRVSDEALGECISLLERETAERRQAA